jgi:hypothetical protein
MALINCAECTKEYSDKAGACPGCGCPTESWTGPVQTIQATGKDWKIVQLIGGILIVVSFATCGSGAYEFHDLAARDALIAKGMLAFLFGVVVYVAGRVGGWWCHG